MESAGHTGTNAQQFNAAEQLYSDQIGSVRAVTNAGGTTDATYTYDPYGNVVSSTNPGSITNNPLGPRSGQREDFPITLTGRPDEVRPGMRSRSAPWARV
jgi:YD repeat-containing protein